MPRDRIVILLGAACIAFASYYTVPRNFMRDR